MTFNCISKCKPFIPILVYTLGLALIIFELAFYPGVFNNKLHIPLIVLILPFTFINLNIVRKPIVIILTTLFIFMSTVLICFQVIETINYPNYIYAKYHIVLETAFLLGAYISLPLSELFLKRITLVKINIIYKPFIFVVIISLLSNLGKSVGLIKITTNSLNSNILSRYPKEYLGVIVYYKLVSTIAPNSSDILIPPESLPWKFTGNREYSLYFLYPRQLIKSYKYKIPEYLFDFDYITLSSEEYPSNNYKIWPDFPVPAKNIYVFNMETYNIQKYPGPYNPADWVDKKPWGLLEL